MKLIEATTCLEAWFKAARHLETTSKWSDYNLALEIAEPMRITERDHHTYDTVNTFLEKRVKHPLSTVINTIFPATLFRHHGAAAVFKRYAEMWPKLRKHSDIHWGTYLRRMTHRSGSNNASFNPLEKLVCKLRAQASLSNPKRGAYELGLLELDDELGVDIPIYDPATDAGPIMRTPCLSHLSFKLREGKRLILTAIYRSHYYVHRAVGNLLGLAWLQHFVATQANVSVGELVCISTMAQLESMAPKGDISGWRKNDVRAMLASL